MSEELIEAPEEKNLDEFITLLKTEGSLEGENLDKFIKILALTGSRDLSQIFHE